MRKFIIIYNGGKQPDTPEEGTNQRAAWGAWVKKLGDAIIDPGTPLGPSIEVSSSGMTDRDSSEGITGFSMVQAENMAAALEMAQTCPFLEIGTVDVAQIMEMG
jgi:hypothetical protein